SDFTVGPVATVNVPIGGSGAAAVAVNSFNGFNSSVALAATGAPSGMTATLNPASVTPPVGDSASSNLTVSVGPATAPGSYTLSVQGTSGAVTHSTSVTVTVVVT